MLTALMTLSLVACFQSGSSNDRTGDADDTRWGPPDTADLDGDGYSPADGDCDDDDPDAYPGAADVWYDGIDSDCGGEDDYDQDGDGLPSWSYAPGLEPGCANVTCDCDDDDDGTSPAGCQGPGSGDVAGPDCDDADPTRSPHRVEDNTNGVDDNCNDGVDNYSLEVTWGGGNVVAAATDNLGSHFLFQMGEEEYSESTGTSTFSWETTFQCEEIPGNCASPEDVWVMYCGSHGATVVNNQTTHCVTWGPEGGEAPAGAQDISHLVERDGNTWYWDGVYSPPSE